MKGPHVAAGAALAVLAVLGILFASGVFSSTGGGATSDPAAPTTGPAEAAPPLAVAPVAPPGARPSPATTTAAAPSDVGPERGTIRGVVQSELGVPVAGVEVHCIGDVGDPSSAPTARAETDAEGRFRFPRCPDVRHELVAGTRTPAASASAIARGVHPGDDVVLVLRAATATLELRVVDTAGAAVSGATVTCVALAAPPASQTTDGDGRVTIGPVPDDWVRLRVESPDVLPTLHVARPSADPMIVRVAAAVRTRVLVRSEQGPVAGAHVRLHHGSGIDEGTTDGTGSVTLRAPPPPRAYLLGVEARGFAPAQARSSDLVTEGDEVRIVLTRGTAMRVQVEETEPAVVRAEANFHGGSAYALLDARVSPEERTVVVEPVPDDCMLVVAVERADGSRFEWIHSSVRLPDVLTIPARDARWSGPVRVVVTPELWCRAGLSLVVASKDLDASRLLRRRLRVPASGVLELPLCGSTGAELALWTDAGERVGTPKVYVGGPSPLRFALPAAVEVHGAVRDRAGRPVAGATVLVTTASGKLLARVGSDVLGAFRAVYAPPADARVGLAVTRTGLGPPPVATTFVGGPDTTHVLTVED